MSTSEEIDLNKFVNTLTRKTKTKEMVWHKVPKGYYHKVLDRPIPNSNIRDCYFADGEGGRVIVGRYQMKVFFDEDDYYLENYFFITIADSNYDDPTTFLESDEENQLGFSFEVVISKLHRLIQLNTNNVAKRINNWF